VSYESVVITEDRPRWLAAGSPPVPTLVLDGTAHALQHPGQAAALLGLETPASEGDAGQVARDVDAVVEAWLELAARTPWEALLQPLPRLRRTPLALAVDIEAQRLHAAQHYRQATTFVRSLGHPVPDLDLGQLHGLHLPSTVY
jgi:hypothetical protein